MSAYLELALTADQHASAEAADKAMRDGRAIERQRENPFCALLTADECAGMDDMALITLDALILPPMQRKAHQDMLAAMRDGALRGLPTIFGGLA